ncbi:Nuclease-related domain-containing protein [Neorhodopirellula lusitana]|uniref:Nuclease-related domain-containing protein n=1 Tax=Neorhodopirellula lusitana TaxID=445327 RepID=A0ABY1QAE0_9BACT|nr:nuclease-related domain-containing protein [Neorhodopirellula lusitana]SMP64244.1 Nuclease-related domain-containing protein [Neorhodopirellula lusitana]
MIVTDKATAAPTDPRGKAGYEAEKQMAFFLRRAFMESRDVLVYNDITLERKGERAQIDHLVLHRFGFVIIESKSITGTVEVNEHGEFARDIQGRRIGMRSPIEQASLQSQLLQGLLNEQKELLRPKKILGKLQPQFSDERFHVFVAISDQGVIERNGVNPPELMKAERVVKEIAEKSKAYEQTQGVMGFVKYMMAKKEEAKQLEDHHVSPFSDEELENIAQFLKRRSQRSGTGHQHATQKRVKQVAPAQVAQPKTKTVGTPFTMQCHSCGVKDIDILYGRYGYYISCRACDKTETVPQKCEICSTKAKLRKKANCFYRDCEACGTQNLVHTNPPPLPNS